MRSNEFVVRRFALEWRRMQRSAALNQLRAWCDQSAGQPIEMCPGRTAVFESRSVRGEEAQREVEARLGGSLPESYRQFMATIGASTLFGWSPRGGGPRFYDPLQVVERSLGAVVERDGGGADRFCFVGEHRPMGDLTGFLVSRPGQMNFDVFCREYPLEEYVAVSLTVTRFMSEMTTFVSDTNSGGGQRDCQRPASHARTSARFGQDAY